MRSWIDWGEESRAAASVRLCNHNVERGMSEAAPKEQTKLEAKGNESKRLA
jgi:hypothetical protein